MTQGGRDAPFVPLPMHGSGPSRGPPPAVRLVYVIYRPPEALEFPGVQGILPGPIFHAAGILLREDEEYLALGEVAFPEENPEYVQRFGRALFPAFRHILTLPKSALLGRKDFPLGGASPGDGPSESTEAGSPPENWTSDKS